MRSLFIDKGMDLTEIFKTVKQFGLTTSLDMARYASVLSDISVTYRLIEEVIVDKTKS